MHNNWSAVSRDIYDRRRMNHEHYIEDRHGASATTVRTRRACPGSMVHPFLSSTTAQYLVILTEIQVYHIQTPLINSSF